MRGWALVSAAALFTALPAAVAAPGSAHAGTTLEQRKLPMRFSWVACEPNCRGWVSAVGIVTADSPGDFDEFARGRDLGGATIVLDSSGGSVNDSIALGRRWRALGALTTVGITVETHTARGDRASVVPEAYCELMCVFLLLSGKTRYVPEAAHVRVHQIWMGDRADDAKAASYTAQDMMIVERDIGRLAKYTFDMGGAGDLLSLALNVPPWEDLHELSRRRIAADQNRHHRCGCRRAAAAGQRRRTDGSPCGQAAAGPLRQHGGRDRGHSATGKSDQDGRSAGSDRRYCGDRTGAIIVVIRGRGETLPLRRCRLFGLGLDLADGVDHGVEGQHGRGVAGLVVAHRLEQRDVGPFAVRGTGRFPSASCERSRATRAVRLRSSRPHDAP